MKKCILFLIPLFTFFVMCQSNNKKEETVLVLPSDTIPMQYSNENPRYRYCLPILNGIVNDSLHFDVFFDTGSSGNNFRIPESFKNLFDSNSAFVQIGKLKKQMRIAFWGSNQSSIISIMGNNTIVVGWRFFENRIIEFDFQNQRILVYDELPDITEYSKIKISISYDKPLIPAQVVIQGKTIKSDSLLIDTGCNDYMVVSPKHIEEQGIDTINAQYQWTTVSGGLKPNFSIPADTIKIGDLFTVNQNTRISFHDYTGDFGLLGTKTLENFSVILDLINYDLYLKKIDN